MLLNSVNPPEKRAFSLLKSLKAKKEIVFCLAYKVYVRSLPESGSVVFSPFLEKDISSLERVQDMFTKRIFMRSQNMKFNETPNKSSRLATLNLTSLESRRKKADMKMMNKILQERVHIPSLLFYAFKSTRTRGSKIKIVFSKYNLKLRRHCFSMRTSYWLSSRKL